MALLIALAGCSGGLVTGGGDDGQTVDGGRGVDAAGALAAVVGPDRSVLGGMAVLLDGSASTGADSYAWAQLEGPTLSLTGADTALAHLELPADLAPGTGFRFRLTVTDPGGATASAEQAVTVKAAVFEDFLAAITDPAQLGNSEGLAFDAAGMWVASGEGFVSRFDARGAFGERLAVDGAPVGMNFRGDGKLVVALSGLGRIDTLDVGTGDLAILADSLVGGGDLGIANYPLVDERGNVYVSNRTGGQVLRYDAASGETKVFLADFGTNPNAMTFGPEPDRLYVGTAGRVWRVPIDSDGTAGTPEVYVDLGSQDDLATEPDGLVFDQAGNLWIGCPNSATLYVAPYRARVATTSSRSFTAVGAAYSFFINTSFGDAAFGETTIYYTNLGNRTVGRVDVGLPRLVPPLSP